MFPELSLHILDVAENSVRANASLIAIEVLADTAGDLLTISIEDDGCGMDEQMAAQVSDPFFTTRTTRKVGLGVPLFRFAAQSAGGWFRLSSTPGRGTRVEAAFVLSHIDRMPLGDITGCVHDLIVFHPNVDFLFTYSYNGKSFQLDTRQMRELLGGVALDTPEVSDWIREYLREQKEETDQGAVF